MRLPTYRGRAQAAAGLSWWPCVVVGGLLVVQDKEDLDLADGEVAQVGQGYTVWNLLCDRSGHHHDDPTTTEAAGSGVTVVVVVVCWRRSVRKQLVVGVVVQLMMQLSGIDAVFYYSTDVRPSPTTTTPDPSEQQPWPSALSRHHLAPLVLLLVLQVFKLAGVADPQLATTLLGTVNVLVTIWALKYMDVAGRRTLLLCVMAWWRWGKKRGRVLIVTCGRVCVCLLVCGCRASWAGMFASYVVLTISLVYITGTFSHRSTPTHPSTSP